MANTIVQPYAGPFVVDVQHLDGVVVDVVPGGAARRGARNPTVIAAFEETIRYHGQIALRASKTRRKNEIAAAGEEAEPEAPQPQ